MARTQTLTATQQYARKMAKKAVPDMIRALAISKWSNLAIIALIMIVTYSHAAMYLNSFHEFGIFAWIIPGILDLSILVDVNTLMTVGMRKRAKTRAMITLSIATLASGSIQAMAPGQVIVKVVFAVLVGIMALRKWAAAAIAPDFAEMESAAKEITTATKPQARKCAKGCTCGRHAVKVPSVPVPAINKLKTPPVNAPLSPAPTGRP